MLRNDKYCNMPFTSEFCKDDFFTYANVSDLIRNCEKDKEIFKKIRTIGILESVNGQFYIKDINSVNKDDAPKLIVSMMYVKSLLQSPVLPYTVQLFGSLQWQCGPVIFASIVQVLNTATALRLSDAMQNICSRHLANN